MQLTPITNLKKAAALASLGVPLVPPQLSRIFVKVRGVVQPQLGFHFATTTTDGLTLTAELSRAYDYPDDYLKPGVKVPLCIMPLLRVALDNRQRLTNALKDALARAGRAWELQDPFECQDTLTKAMEGVFPFVMTPVGVGHMIMPMNASEKNIKEATRLLQP